MIENCGYYRYDEEELYHTQYNIQVNCAGHYILDDKKSVRTSRLKGREDFQVIYLEQGQSRFWLNEQWETVNAGSIVVYYPHLPQVYEYPAACSPDVYWVHFTGSEAQLLMENCGFLQSGIYDVGTAGEYGDYFQQMIKELQLKRTGYIELGGLCLQTLMYCFRRNMQEEGAMELHRNKSIEAAIHYFHNFYREDISINTFAASQNMTVCWFIRSFKRYTGLSPKQYIIQLRIQRAKELLTGNIYNVGEVAALVGFQNPLYFSRLFKQYTGLTPTQYSQSDS